MRRQISNTALLLLAAILLAAGMSSCRKDIEFYREDDAVGETWDQDGPQIEFSAYAGGAATKAISHEPDYILGCWDTTSTSYLPGTGIGVFAFYQKAKSNGYPNNFNNEVLNDSDGPNFMYNQKLERTSSDGSSYQFVYTPKKYWPNNTNDQISFFAYAPYDVTTAVEDLKLESTIKGDRVWRHYELESAEEDQTDFLWSDPALNKTKTGVGDAVSFSFRHICAKIGVTCQINVSDNNNYITIDKVVFRSKFNAEGDYVYRLSTNSGAWENLERSYHTKDYIQFKASGTDEHRVDTTLTRVGGEACYLFPFPGTQNITVTVTLSHNITVNHGTPQEEIRRFSGDITKTFTAMKLEEGKAYDFHIGITMDPIDIGAVAVTDWTIETVDYPIP